MLAVSTQLKQLAVLKRLGDLKDSGTGTGTGTQGREFGDVGRGDVTSGT